MQLWTIHEVATGKVLAASFSTKSEGSHPKDAGWAWDAATQKATRISAVPDLLFQRWSGTAWVDDIAKVREQILNDVKAEAESRKMVFLSPGGAKKAEYAQKAGEVSFYDSLGGTVIVIIAAIGGMTAAQRQAKFGYALADAAANGEPTIAAAIERFRSGMTGASKVPAIAAAEAKACAAIKAATTIAAARAAAAVSWPT